MRIVNILSIMQSFIQYTTVLVRVEGVEGVEDLQHSLERPDPTSVAPQDA